MKLVFLLLLSSIALLGCNIDKCEGVPTASSASVSLLLLNASGTQTLFTSPSYNRDSVRVRDEQGRTVTLTTSLLSERLSFPLFELGQLPVLGRPVTRQFLLYLNRADQDTIRVECELYQPECINPDLRRVIIYYNDNKVHEGSSGFIPELTIRKP